MPPRPRPSTDPRLTVGPPLSPWEPVARSDRPLSAAELKALSESPLRLATVIGAEQPTLIVETPFGVFERQLRPPLALPDEMQQGAAAEWIAQSVASAWGLPDFVFRPERVAKGAAWRELGDGTVLVGGLALAMQSKSRHGDVVDQARERRWLVKNMTAAARQAAGTIRSLRAKPTPLTNGRGRAVVVDGNSYQWIRVVLLDHPNVPPDVVPPEFHGDLPTVVLLRSDWEFLFDQLRSVHAVAEYLLRASKDDPAAVGGEAVRYYEYARLDETAAAPPAASVLEDPAATPTSLPSLPMAPAGSEDRVAHGVYRIMLDDIAATTVQSQTEELNRLWALSELDRLAVAARTELGRHLLTMLEQAYDADHGRLVVNHRRFVFSEGRQLAFSVASRFDEGARNTFHAWVQLRHHEFQQQSGVIDDAVTIGVMLTPRLDGARRWDTTMLAVVGDQSVDPEDLADWTAFFERSRRAGHD